MSTTPPTERTYVPTMLSSIARMHNLYLTFWRRPAAMTAELPWTSVGAATGYRGHSWVSTASATAHGTSTATATVVATAHATVLSVAPSVAPTMATHGNSRPLPRQFLRNCRGNVHGHPRSLPRQHGKHHGCPRKSAAIATAVSADVQPKQFTRPYVAVRCQCHGNPSICGDYHGSTGVLPQHVPRFYPWQTPSYQPCPRESAANAMAVSAEASYGSPARSPGDTHYFISSLFTSVMSLGSTSTGISYGLRLRVGSGLVPWF